MWRHSILTFHVENQHALTHFLESAMEFDTLVEEAGCEKGF